VNPTTTDRRELLGGGGGSVEAGGRVRIARILEEDPELGEGLGGQQLAAATEAARAGVAILAPGEWRPAPWPASVTAGFGLLVLDGLLLRRVALGERSAAELLAAGDLLRPWQREDGEASVPRRHAVDVLEACRLAVLDIDFAERVSRFPQIASALIGRAMRRSRHFAVNLAIVQQPRVEARLHLLLWHLADRWGTVRPDGVFVPLRLTQSVLAQLVAARRPTVSAALGELERDGLLMRTPSGWLLLGAPPGAGPLV
jgi:CRP/FNR family transcriptional regulator, cyclic AMP receptor protein